MRKLETVKVPAGSIHPHPRNPRRGDIEVIKESIEANGLYRPVIVQKSTGNILAGNHTYKALVGMGETEIPAIFVDVDNETATRILLADNRTADLGEYDEQQLNQLLKGLEEFTGTGWTEREAHDLDRSLQKQLPG